MYWERRRIYLKPHGVANRDPAKHHRNPHTVGKAAANQSTRGGTLGTRLSSIGGAVALTHMCLHIPPPQLFLFILFWLLIAPSSVYCVTPSVARDLSLLLQVLAVLLTFNVEC